MAGDGPDTNDSYSSLVGLVYIFNLIVGTGALTMPAAFKDAGWLLSLVIVIILAFMSYLTTTFVIEAMASANALVHWKTLQHYKRVVDEDESSISRSKQEDMVRIDMASCSLKRPPAEASLPPVQVVVRGAGLKGKHVKRNFTVLTLEKVLREY